MKNRNSIVLLSGGIDSAVALFWGLAKGVRVQTLTFDYFHRSRKETAAALKLSKLVNCKNLRIDVNFLREIEDLRTGESNPLLSKAPSGYISCRNVVFYGIAASFAEATNSKFIIGGHNKDDVTSFPDSSRKFFDMFNDLTAMGLYTGDATGRVVLPLSKLSKKDVVKLGNKLGVPFELTWSCYRSGKKPCHVCPACKLRKLAFRQAGIPDPLTK